MLCGELRLWGITSGILEKEECGRAKSFLHLCRVMIPGLLLETRCAVWRKESFGNSSTLSPRILCSRQGLFHPELHWQLLPLCVQHQALSPLHCIPEGSREPGSIPLLEKYGLNPLLSFHPYFTHPSCSKFWLPLHKRINPFL